MTLGLTLMRHATWIAIAIAVLGSGSYVEAGECTTPTWKYAAPGKLDFFDVTLLGDVIVGSAQGVACLDAATGAVKWTRADGIGYEDGFDRLHGRAYGELYTKDTVYIIDPLTGDTRWK